MKILILGGTRFFGKKLAALLLENGHQLTLATRGNVQDEFENRVTRFQVDRSNVDQMKQCFRKMTFDVVYDQIAYNRDHVMISDQVFSGNVGKYIYTSSLSAYLKYGANLREEDMEYRLRESADPGGAYGQGKQDAEKYLFENTQFHATAVRFPFVLGEDDWLKRLEFHVDKILKKEELYFTNPSALFSPIHSDDAAKGLFHLLDREVPGGINICPSQPISLRYMIEQIESITGVAAKYAESKETAHTSPYDMAQDWYMNTERIHSMNFSCEPITNWLPKLIRAIAPRSI